MAHRQDYSNERYGRNDADAGRARRLSYEEERRQRDRPWSPAQQPTSETPAPHYSGYGGAGTGGHRGKGPRGYTRSDERIREIICERMLEDDFLDASNIEVEVQNGEVTLTGTVDERRAKRHAEDLADECAGVADVHNNIRVVASH